jgi:hypothetical protein
MFSEETTTAPNYPPDKRGKTTHPQICEIHSVSTILADRYHQPHAQPRVQLHSAQARRTQRVALSNVLANRAGDAVEGMDLI